MGARGQPTLSVTSEIDTSTNDVSTITEGLCQIQLKPEFKTFYNPAQEVNRDVSILGIQTYINITPVGKHKKPEEVSVLEAMAASGIRSIRYAKEIGGISKIVANDLSEDSVGVIRQNCSLNKTESLVRPNCSDACVLMHSQPNTHFVVDIDPYGTPVPFLDAAIHSVRDGGLLLVTATDLAILAGNAAETCFAKYGSMSLKSDACHELALRIIIHTVQATANKCGRYVEPLLSLKIDFYVRLFFRVKKGPEVCKKSASQTSMVFQCVSCKSFCFQPLGIIKPDGKYGFSQGPPLGNCDQCQSTHHIGGPIWTGSIHDKGFVKGMLDGLDEKYHYLGTRGRIEGMLNLVLEEIESPLYYKTSQLCSFLKAPAIPMLKVRSALMNLGFEVSMSHTGPNALKTNAPNRVLWDVIRTWAVESCPTLNSTLQEPARRLMAKPRENWTPNINFTIRDDANPASRNKGLLRYQQNLSFGPGVRNTFRTITTHGKVEEEGTKNNKRKRKHPPESTQ